MHDDVLRDLRARDDELEPGPAGVGDLLGRRRPQDEQPRRRKRAPQRECLPDGGDAQSPAPASSAAAAQSWAPCP